MTVMTVTPMMTALVATARVMAAAGAIVRATVVPMTVALVATAGVTAAAGAAARAGALDATVMSMMMPMIPKGTQIPAHSDRQNRSECVSVAASAWR